MVIIPYLFFAAITEIFLLLKDATGTYSDVSMAERPLLDLVETLNPTLSKKINLLSSISRSLWLNAFEYSHLRFIVLGQFLVSGTDITDLSV